MTLPESFPGQTALMNAKDALHKGNHRQARNWAAQAARLNPNLEEPWLILAAIASPHASIKYLQQALKINPDSQRAQKGMIWAIARVQSEFLEHTHPVNTSSSKTQEIQIYRPGLEQTARIRLNCPAKKTNPPVSKASKIITQLSISFLAFFFILLLGAVIWFGLSNISAVRAWNASAPRPVGALQKFTLTSTPSASPTSTASPTPTLTPTTPPTITPTATQTKEPTPTPTAPPSLPPEETTNNAYGIDENRWIDVNLSEQRVYAYEGEQIVNEFVVSTGTSQYPTITGQYRIYVKYLQSDMSGPGYYLSNVPYVMYFYSGYGLHGTYWHNNFGVPMSHGCINLQTDDAGWLYNWSEIGTLVNIHY